MSDINVFSLEEEEDYNNLFITQESSQSGGSVNQQVGANISGNDNFLGLKQSDFMSPCSSLVQQEFNYSDISDDEVFENIQLQNYETK